MSKIRMVCLCLTLVIFLAASPAFAADRPLESAPFAQAWSIVLDAFTKVRAALAPASSDGHNPRVGAAELAPGLIAKIGSSIEADGGGSPGD